MPRNESPSASPIRFGVVRRDSATESLAAVTERLANAEQELRVQFIRIAQLQAQLDLVLGALRRSPDRIHVLCASAASAPLVTLDDPAR